MWRKYLPRDKHKLGLLGALISIAVGSLILMWSVYVLETYGLVLFVLMPALMGYTVAVVTGMHPHTEIKHTIGYTVLALGLFCTGLLAFAIEGIICIVMAAPIALALALTGMALGFALHKHCHNRSHQGWLLLLIASPFLSAFESTNNGTMVRPVITTIDIAAPPQAVWDQIIEFPQLKDPTEWFFKAGLAYPINAHIEGSGVGAVRYCNFSTGSFVEPITVWDEPNLLAFDVTAQPAPMVELSPYDIEPPHLHGYFTSVRGQFELIELPNGATRLEGTTWYYVEIHPEFYWRWWSDYIVHNIHERVLGHIKELSEEPMYPAHPQF
jgi:hypothetical protein